MEITLTIGDANLARLVAALESWSTREPGEADAAYVRRFLVFKAAEVVQASEANAAAAAVVLDKRLFDAATTKAILPG